MGVYDIQGINCVFQVKIGNDYKTVVCAKSFTFNPVTDMKETTTVGSGFWKEFRPRKLSYTITFNGMLQVASLTTQEVAKTLFTYQIQFLPLEYQLLYTDNSSNMMVVRGTVYVTSSLFDASPVNLVNATQELQGSGPIEVLDAIPQPVNINITSTGDPAIAALIQFRLYDINGDLFFDSGQLPGASGGDLAHPVSVTGQVQSGSYYFVWQVTSNSVGNTFDLDAPPTKNTVFNDNTQSENTVGVQLYDFTADRNVDFAFGIISPPPACVAPGIISDLNNPTATVGTYWLGTVVLSGSQPFTISNVTKPSWMSLSLSGNVVTLEGNPDAGINQDISFDVTNACGTISYVDTIDVSANPDGVIIEYTYTEPGTPPASFCSFKIYINAVLHQLNTTSTSNSVAVNPGDVIEIQIVGSVGSIKHVIVESSISGVIEDQQTTAIIESVVFTTVLGHDYTITATATNP
jgi:hypothetical protein